MEIEGGVIRRSRSRDLHNSLDYNKAEFNNCFIIHLKYFLITKKNKTKKQAKTGLPPSMLSSSSIAYVYRQV